VDRICRASGQVSRNGALYEDDAQLDNVDESINRLE
jgi:hypothetical protein